MQREELNKKEESLVEQNYGINEHRPMSAYYDDSKIIGYYSLALQDNNECELNNLCVLPLYRHKHIGARLLEDAYIKAKNENRGVD